MACGTSAWQEYTELQTVKTLTNAIENNDVNNFRKVVSTLYPSFFGGRKKHSFTLYVESMRKKRKEIFDFLLTFLTKPDVGTLAALEYVLNGQNSVPDYYANELLNKYSSVTNDENLLVITAREKYIHVTKFLLDKGVDVNVEERNGFTPLYRVLVTKPDHNSEELVMILLSYGAKPSTESRTEYNCFELAVRNEHTDLVQEALFDLTFDNNHSRYKLHVSVLLHLAKMKSPLCHRLINYDVEPFLDEYIRTHFAENVNNLLVLELDYFKIILEKYSSICCQIFEKYVFCQSNFGLYFLSDSAGRRKYFYVQICVCPGQVLTKFKLLLQGPATLNKCVIDFIKTLNSYKVFCDISNNITENEVTETLALLLTCGLRVRTPLFDVVFQKYGYCELFKLLLCVDIEDGVFLENALVFCICEVNSTVDTLSLNDYEVDSVLELTNYFVHPKLTEFRSRKKLTVPGNYPAIPSLVEIARNTFRKYFVTKLGIKTTKQFYTLLNRLPISATYKKIISFETKLYGV